MKKFIMFILLLALPLMQGCAVGIAAAGIGAAIEMGRSGKAKVIKARGEYTEKYNNYRVELEKINLEREKSGLKPVNIPTFDEWLDTQPLTPDEIKLFKKYGATTTKELKKKDAAGSKEDLQTNTTSTK